MDASAALCEQSETQPAPAPKPKLGRPALYISPEVEDQIFDRLAIGESLVSICKDPIMPSYTSVFRWEEKSEAFRNNLARARDEQAEYFAEQIIDLSDEAHDSESAAVAKIRIYARERRAAMLKPKKYGDKPNNVVINNNVVMVSDEQRAARIARRQALLEGVPKQLNDAPNP